MSWRKGQLGANREQDGVERPRHETIHGQRCQGESSFLLGYIPHRPIDASQTCRTLSDPTKGLASGEATPLRCQPLQNTFVNVGPLYPLVSLELRFAGAGLVRELAELVTL